MLTYNQPFNPSAAGPITDICELPLSRFTTTIKQIQLGPNVGCMDWSDDGLHFYYGRLVSNTAENAKSTGNPWEIDELVSVGVFRVESLEDTDGIRVKPDGTEVWVNAHTGLGAGQTLSYSLPTPYEWTETGISQPVLISQKSNQRAEFRHLNDLNIRDDGTKVISWGTDSQQFPYQLDMAAWDVDTLAYGADNKIITASNCFVPKSGTCMYVSAGQVINKYAFGTPWELTTLGNTILDAIDLSASLTGDIVAMFITDNRLFVSDQSNKVYQYNA